MAENLILRPTIFFQPLDHHHELQIITAYHIMQNREKLTRFGQENGLKPHLSPFLALIWPILGPTTFFQPLDNHQALQTINAYHNMQNREKLRHYEQENVLKLHLSPFLALNGPFLGQIIFFSKIGIRHFFTLIVG